MKTVFLLGFLPNPRIKKRIELAKRSSEVYLVCWDRGRDMMIPPNEQEIACHIIHISAGNDPILRMIPFLRFRKNVLKLLRQIRPDIIHVQGMDMLQIACEYKRNRKSIHVIYEVADLHRLLVDKQKGIIRKTIQSYLKHKDKSLAKRIDLLIVTSQEYYNSYFSSFVPEKKMMFFPNVPDLTAFVTYKKKMTTKSFTVGYFGVIRYKEELKLLIESLRETNVNLIIAGYEENGDEIETLCRDRNDIEWIGRFDFNSSAAELYSRCDCIFAVYDAKMKNCQVALPNKLYEAVFCELPILVADETYVGDIVRLWNVGIPVKHDSKAAIEDALLELKDKNKYSEYVSGCISHKEEIDLEKYNDLLCERINGFLSTL